MRRLSRRRALGWSRARLCRQDAFYRRGRTTKRRQAHDYPAARQDVQQFRPRQACQRTLESRRGGDLRRLEMLPGCEVGWMHPYAIVTGSARKPPSASIPNGSIPAWATSRAALNFGTYRPHGEKHTPTLSCRVRISLHRRYDPANDFPSRFRRAENRPMPYRCLKLADFRR